MKYAQLITIRLKHSYYDGELCPDFSVTTNAETVRLLNNHRCVIKPNAYGLSVYAPVENQQPLIPFVSPSKFSFDLNLQKDEFALYTDQTFELPNPEGIQLQQAGKPLKVNSLDLVNTNQPLLSIAIQRDFNQLNVTSAEIHFLAKPVSWIYYVVTDSGNGEQLTIDDAALKTTWQPQTPLASDGVYTQLQQQYADKSIIYFVSEQTLACQESCSKQLQLRQGNATVFEQLPVPSYRNRVSIKELHPPDAIYQVVKYFTNSTK